MFFDTNQVNDTLLCNKCEGKLDIPKCLPCGEVICSLCESLIHVQDNKFDCIVCEEKHEMLIKGLPTIKPLLKILSMKLSKVSRGKAFDSLLKLLDEIEIKQRYFKLGIENSTDLVNTHCMDLRNDVQLTAEEAIQQINDLSGKIIEEIDEYEQKLIEYNKTNSKLLDEFNAIAKELETFYSAKKEYLKKNEVDEELVIKSNEEATNLIKKAELEIENLKDVIFDGKILKFEKNKDKINRSILGLTQITNTSIMDSVILEDRLKIKELIVLCEFPIDQKWTLIYRASRDGFEASQFHSKCDRKPNTLVIIKSEHGNVFGGYTEQDWTPNDNIMKSDFNSFIFSLINKKSKPIKLKSSNPQKAIWSNSVLGPVFGCGPGILIHENSNMNKDSYSHLGITGGAYKHPEYAENSAEAKSFLAGSERFKVLEIEVYMKN
jgi:hypothetical protein